MWQRPGFLYNPRVSNHVQAGIENNIFFQKGGGEASGFSLCNHSCMYLYKLYFPKQIQSGYSLINLIEGNENSLKKFPDTSIWYPNYCNTCLILFVSLSLSTTQTQTSIQQYQKICCFMLVSLHTWALHSLRICMEHTQHPSSCSLDITPLWSISDLAVVLIYLPSGVLST